MEQAVISDILLGIFIVAIIANAVALFRHYQALRMFNIALANLQTALRENELHSPAPTPKRNPDPPPDKDGIGRKGG